MSGVLSALGGATTVLACRQMSGCHAEGNHLKLEQVARFRVFGSGSTPAFQSQVLRAICNKDRSCKGFSPASLPSSPRTAGPATFIWNLHRNHWLLSDPKCRHSMLRTRIRVSNIQMGFGQSKAITIILKQLSRVSLYYFGVSTKPCCVFSSRSIVEFKELESKFMVNMGMMELRCSCLLMVPIGYPFP